MSPPPKTAAELQIGTLWKESGWSGELGSRRPGWREEQNASRIDVGHAPRRALIPKRGGDARMGRNEGGIYSIPLEPLPPTLRGIQHAEVIGSEISVVERTRATVDEDGNAGGLEYQVAAPAVVVEQAARGVRHGGQVGGRAAWVRFAAGPALERSR